MRGLAILLSFNLVGVGLKEWLHIPMPGNVIGLVLFTIALFAKLVKLEWVEASAQWLTKHMMLFFIPYIVGAMALIPMLGAQLFPIALSVVLGPLLVVAAVGFVTAKLEKPSGREEKLL
ncbi:CidA/LrgA family protein [Cohnella faecalis]|uniref:CidA/LrgA family protein n=2 Tax=Cohnella faecalis TaxID=2315694 RepID=A0A398CP35_9BACL|nr:CidA/LrgA family protein [Cohnella faecalis]